MIGEDSPWASMTWSTWSPQYGAVSPQWSYPVREMESTRVGGFTDHRVYAHAKLALLGHTVTISVGPVTAGR